MTSFKINSKRQDHVFPARGFVFEELTVFKAMRHATADVTLNVYSHSNYARLEEQMQKAVPSTPNLTPKERDNA